MYRRIQLFWKLRKAVFIVASNSNTLQSPSADVQPLIKRNIDIYLQPLIKELKMLWKNGILTYDLYKGQKFCLRAALMWTISDFLTYLMLLGWSTHSKNACPHCMSNSKAFYLRHSRKMFWFDCHRMFLPNRYPFRRDRVNFMARVQEEGHALHIRTDVKLLAELNM